MNARREFDIREPARALGAAIAFVLGALRLVVFAVLALLEPVVLWLLTALVVVLVALCGFYGLVHPAHFPFGVVAGLIGLCGVAALVYYALMFLLLPVAGSGQR